MSPLINTIDQSLLALTLRMPGSWRPLMEAASIVGQPLIMAGALGILGLVAFRRGLPMVAWASAYGIAGIILGNFLKLAWQRARPVTYEPLVLHSYSFPSGHAMGSAIALGLIGYLSIKHLPGPWGWVALVGCLALIALIGVSRIYLGAHFPTDVLGGWLLALVVIVVIIAVTRI